MSAATDHAVSGIDRQVGDGKGCKPVDHAVAAQGDSSIQDCDAGLRVENAYSHRLKTMHGAGATVRVRAVSPLLTAMTAGKPG